MSIIYDCYCEKCDKVEEQWLGMDEEPRKCSCGGKMHKMPGGNFKLIYDNKTQMCGWASDGYAHNAYWDEYKDKKFNGENVKPLGED